MLGFPVWASLGDRDGPFFVGISNVWLPRRARGGVKEKAPGGTVNSISFDLKVKYGIVYVGVHHCFLSKQVQDEELVKTLDDDDDDDDDNDYYCSALPGEEETKDIETSRHISQLDCVKLASDKSFQLPRTKCAALKQTDKFNENSFAECPLLFDCLFELKRKSDYQQLMRRIVSFEELALCAFFLLSAKTQNVVNKIIISSLKKGWSKKKILDRLLMLASFW